MTIEIVDVDGGILIAVKAQPGARRKTIVGEYAGMLKVCVTEKAENGKANEAIAGLLAKQLDVPKTRCSIRTGFTSRKKRVFVAGMSVSEALERLGMS